MVINVKINGKEENVKRGSTVLAILEQKDVRPEMVAVELNGNLISKEEYGQKTLAGGDILEFLYYMAGGNIAGTGYGVPGTG